MPRARFELQPFEVRFVNRDKANAVISDQRSLSLQLSLASFFGSAVFTTWLQVGVPTSELNRVALVASAVLAVIFGALAASKLQSRSSLISEMDSSVQVIRVESSTRSTATPARSTFPENPSGTASTETET